MQAMVCGCRRLLFLVLAVVLASPPVHATPAPPVTGPSSPPSPSQFNVVWTDLQPESSTTFGPNLMPIGNGRVAANVWINANYTTTGVLCMSALLQSPTAYGENGELLVVGRVSLCVPTAAAAAPATSFTQTLDLETATVRVCAAGIDMRAYIDAVEDVLVLEARSSQGHGRLLPTGIAATVHPLRTQPSSSTPQFDCVQYTVSEDTVTPDQATRTIQFAHRNTAEGFYAGTLRQLNLGSLDGRVPNRFVNRTFGGVLFGDTGDWLVGEADSSGAPPHLRLAEHAHCVRVGVAVAVEQTTTPEEFSNLLLQRARAGLPNQNRHNASWTEFWQRSWLVPSEPTIASMYALQRYTQALQARGGAPIKFNGMLFTANTPDVDYRQWGGLNWWQNLRMPYYNMFAAGDLDLLRASLLDPFYSTKEFARLKTLAYYPNITLPGAMFWTEYTHPLLGSTHPNSYGCNRGDGKSSEPIWYSEDPWNHYNLQGSLDLSLFILDLIDHTANRTAFAHYLEIVEGVLLFYKTRWTERDANGHIIMFPTQALETWQCPDYPPSITNCAINDAPTIAGLISVLQKYVSLPDSVVSRERKAAWAAFLATIPPLPQSGGTLQPCAVCPPSTSNVENAELYSVHPYRLFTVGRQAGDASFSLEPALAAFAAKRFTEDIGWDQNAMDAALLGLTVETRSYVEARAYTPPAPGYRFPTMAPHNQDYPPSSDHFAVFANALTYMLMQPLDIVGGEGVGAAANNTPGEGRESGGVVLFPTWPCDWDVKFRLHAPRGVVVEGELRGGALVFLTVSPPERRSAVVVHKCTEILDASEKKITNVHISLKWEDKGTPTVM